MIKRSLSLVTVVEILQIVLLILLIIFKEHLKQFSILALSAIAWPILLYVIYSIKSKSTKSVLILLLSIGNIGAILKIFHREGADMLISALAFAPLLLSSYLLWQIFKQKGNSISLKFGLLASILFYVIPIFNRGYIEQPLLTILTINLGLLVLFLLIIPRHIFNSAFQNFAVRAIAISTLNYIAIAYALQ